MVGEALAALGYTQIVGIDLSEEMLEIARKNKFIGICTKEA